MVKNAFYNIPSTMILSLLVYICCSCHFSCLLQIVIRIIYSVRKQNFGDFRTCDALCDLVPFVQFKKREKHLWRSVNFSKVARFTEINTPPWMFFTFFKLYRWYQIAQRITYTKG